MTRNLMIVSTDNEDWNGNWEKKEVEAELRELDVYPSGDDWINWIFDHVFCDEKDLKSDVLDFFIQNDNIHEITFELHNGRVSITKF